MTNYHIHREIASGREIMANNPQIIDMKNKPDPDMNDFPGVRIRSTKRQR